MTQLMNVHSGIDYTDEDMAVFSRIGMTLLVPQLGGDRNDASLMALREIEKHRSRNHKQEAWHLHRRRWFPSRYGQ